MKIVATDVQDGARSGLNLFDTRQSVRVPSTLMLEVLRITSALPLH
jgi:hypothetical protein